MATIPKLLARAALTTSDTTVYTVPSNTTTIIKHIMLCNTTGSARLVRVEVVPNGGTAGAASAIVYDFSLGANLPWSELHFIVMAAGDFLSVKADAGGVTITVSGVEVS
jgi:hypothetical protein